MIDDGLSDKWAERFGLAQVPLFEAGEGDGGRHDVLLDGGHGSFALSQSEDRIWRGEMPAEWSWSSNVPHHVTVTSQEVAVVRWDEERTEHFTRTSVDRQIDTFYDYLVKDRVRSNRRVVDYMVTLFRRVRSLVADAGMDDGRSVDAYLGILSRAMGQRAGTEDGLAGVSGLGSDAGDAEAVLAELSDRGVRRVLEYVDHPWIGGNPPLKIHPSLAVRHAGSEIFQEAHFELVRGSGVDLFGDVQPAESSRVTRSGTHFTPPALARSLVERTLADVEDLHGRRELVVFDPACGSGAFLHEVLRALRRLGIEGTVRLIGWDNSAVAVSMARFVLENAFRDWRPGGGGAIELKMVDSLSMPMPTADVVLMNPPFISWQALTAEQREQVAGVLGPTLRGRADLSMAFLTSAVRSVAPGGAVGSLLPASLLAADRAGAWRDDLLDQADVTFLGTFADFGLFIHAMVQVAATVLSKRSCEARARDVGIALRSGNDRVATGNALRELRKGADDSAREGQGWQIFPFNVGRLRKRPTWRLVPPAVERTLARLLESGRAVTAGDLFHVRQGVRTGMNSAFILKVDERNELPEAEWRWFRGAIGNSSISGGRIEISEFVFYPYGVEGLKLRSEKEVAEAVPQFYGTHLLPNRERLAARAGHVRQGRDDWWGLAWPREWERAPGPRVATKYFGGRGAFAADVDARYVVVQGFAWIPKEGVDYGLGSGDTGIGLELDDVLYAYAAMLNSMQFERLLEVYSPQLAGGQFDLSPRFVRHLPLPDLFELALDEEVCAMVRELAELGAGQVRLDEASLRAIDGLTGRLYGFDSLDEL